MEGFQKTVNVFCRFRPDNDSEILTCSQCIEYSGNEPEYVAMRLSNAEHSFRFTKVFSEDTTQREIFKVCAAPLLKGILGGYNAAVIAYGQTGAGKTHTILGREWDDPEKVGGETEGVLPRMMRGLFESITNSRHIHLVYDIHASYIELYNERI